MLYHLQRTLPGRTGVLNMGSRVVLSPGRVPLRQPGSCLFSPQGVVPLLERHVLAAPFVPGVCSAKYQCICL